ncbi:Haze protective factor 1 [Streptomyces alboflavus]|uniref:Haze protective factor 1 n=1 Tax=Streptomyces alboflavus TaxID=67267 RepID=UPI001F02A5C1|nr:Haze protective factor 1 [Streptomyces alboflavus]
MAAERCVSAIAHLYRGIFAIDQMRRPSETERPDCWDLEIDFARAVTVGDGTAVFNSDAPSHDVEVTLRCASQPPPLGGEFVELGEWPFVSYSGDLVFSTTDGPEPELCTRLLEADREYRLRVWAKGRDTAREAFERLQGEVFPITGLEEYVILFETT